MDVGAAPGDHCAWELENVTTPTHTRATVAEDGSVITAEGEIEQLLIYSGKHQNIDNLGI